MKERMKQTTMVALVSCLLLSGCKREAAAPSTAPEPGGGAPVVAGGGGPLIARPDLRTKAMDYLRQIGLAYQNAATQGPVNGPGDIKAFLEGGDRYLVSPRDKKPFDIVYKVRLDQLPAGRSGTLLAWEATPESNGGRAVLFADCNGVRFVSSEEFARLPKAKSN